jgi:hypothetical protein
LHVQSAYAFPPEGVACGGVDFPVVGPGHGIGVALDVQAGGDAHIVRSVARWNQWFPSLAAIEKPMFPGYRFGGPAFINFGRNNENARDDFVYVSCSPKSYGFMT